MAWQRLETVATDRLWPARLQVHWALQPLAAVGKLLLPHQPDSSEQSFRWTAKDQVLAQGPVGGGVRFRAALKLAPPSLLLLPDDEESPRALVLAGQTLDEAYRWVAANCADFLGRPLPGELERPSGPPPHPFATGAPFDGDDIGAYLELGRLYANADAVLSAWAAPRLKASSVLCWPHHLDIATLLTLELDANGEASRSVGLGMVPGDEGRQEPYFYATPFPTPEGAAATAHPPLPPGGRWNTAGWFGAVLPVSALAAEEAGEQERRLAEFLNTAAAACEQLVSAREMHS